MIADPSSLIELGVLPPALGAWPLGAWLDGTHARPASDALRRMLQSPLADADAIRMRQRLLEALTTLRPLVDWAALCALAKQVEAYLSSNYVLVPSGAVARASFAWSHGDIVRHIADQVRAVASFVELADALYARLRSLPPDAAALRITARFEAVVLHRARECLRDVPREFAVSALHVARHDRVLREVPSGEDPPEAFATHLRALVPAVWEFDALCALAEASAQLQRDGGSVPVMLSRGEAVELEGLRHPLLPCGVANDVTLATHERVVFLTGPNMAGKSTMLRATAGTVCSRCSTRCSAARM